MLRSLLTIAVVSLLGAGSASAQAPERLFYYVDREDAWESLQAHIASIDVLAPSAYFVDEDGIVYGDLDPRVIDLARRNGVALMPLLVNRGFDQAELHELLSDDAARARIASDLVEICRRNGYQGIQIDFENLSIHDRDAFTGFYREVAKALHGAGRTVSIAVVHRPDELAGPTAYHEWLMDSWRGGYDLKAIADAGDFVSVMTYSQHTRRTPPGPNASLPWAEDVVKYFLRFMPAEKLSLGIPVGAQHWYTSYEERITPELARSYSQQLSHDWAMGILERNGGRPIWDDQHQVSYGFYPRGGTFEWIFFEDARSFRSKLDLMNRHRLRGFSVWVLGPEDPAIWEALPPRTAR